jgi:ABC-type multidrug transport system permease subunit
MVFFLLHLCAQHAARNDVFNTLTSILYFVFLFASNMFYHLEPLPKWFRWAALGNPITWQIDCLRWGTIGLGRTDRVLLEAAGFCLFALASFWYAARCLERQE